MCALKSPKPPALDRDGAETLALRTLAFLADDPRRMTRFLALTGLEPAELMAQAETPSIQIAALDHLLTDESLLLVFAGHAGVAPETIPAARALLETASSAGTPR
jgi:hypothetical protein